MSLILIGAKLSPVESNQVKSKFKASHSDPNTFGVYLLVEHSESNKSRAGKKRQNTLIWLLS